MLSPIHGPALMGLVTLQQGSGESVLIHYEETRKMANDEDHRY